MTPFSPEAFFDLPVGPAAALFKDVVHVWDAVAALPAYIEKIIQPEVLGEVEEGAWLEPGAVQLGKGSVVQRGAIVRGPTIIGENTVIRSGANIRGHVMIGDHCIIGGELRHVLTLNHTNVAHSYSGVFTSLLGNRVNVAGLSGTPNLRLDGQKIVIRIKQDGKIVRYPTGLTYFGSVVGDDTKLAGLSVLQPGTVIGRRCVIYPQTIPSGYIPHNSLVIPKSVSFSVIPRID